MTQQLDHIVEIATWAVGDRPLRDAADGTGFAGPGLVAAIGNFDGVHKGHQQVIPPPGRPYAAGLLPAVITFDPHPREFFRYDETPFRLTDRQEKDRLLTTIFASMGPARVIHVVFDELLRRTEANEFVTGILDCLGVRQIIAGRDFAFGKDRTGDLDSINKVGASVGIIASPVPLLTDENSAVVSSSRVRAALQAGTPCGGGHAWSRLGGYRHRDPGDARGRTIGFDRKYCTCRVATSGVWGLCGRS